MFSTGKGTVQMVPLSSKDSVSHPLWSPDGIRLAFEATDNGVVSILDYNAQNHGVLTISSGINSEGNTGNSLLTLDWSPSLDAPAITWSVGTIRHVRSLWLRRVGAREMAQALLLLAGAYVH